MMVRSSPAKALQDHHLGPREQRRVHFKRRILCGGADQNDRACLHMGQKRSCWPVETMDLVDEQKILCPRMSRRCAASATASRTSLTPAITADMATKLALVSAAKSAPGWSCGARRPHRMSESLLAVERPPQPAARSEQMLLAHVLGHRHGPHALGQRLAASVLACACAKRSTARSIPAVSSTTRPAGLARSPVVDVDQALSQQASHCPFERLLAQAEQRANLLGVRAIPSLGAPGRLSNSRIFCASSASSSCACPRSDSSILPSGCTWVTRKLAAWPRDKLCGSCLGTSPTNGAHNHKQTDRGSSRHASPSTIRCTQRHRFRPAFGHAHGSRKRRCCRCTGRWVDVRPPATSWSALRTAPAIPLASPSPRTRQNPCTPSP